MFAVADGVALLREIYLDADGPCKHFDCDLLTV